MAKLSSEKYNFLNKIFWPSCIIFVPNKKERKLQEKVPIILKEYQLTKTL